jgi:hypothetical protein
MAPTQAISSSKRSTLGLALRGVPAAFTSLSDCESVAKMAILPCLLIWLSLSGCTVCENAKRTILREPREFSWRTDRKESLKVYRAWADRAWCQQRSADPEQRESSAYQAGFKDGFVDYVFAGGAGEPPPVPPRRFWNVDERNRHGHAEATDWFAGYRHGAQLARAKGYREWATVPASIFLPSPDEEGRTDQPSFRQSPFVSEPPQLPAEIVQPESVIPRLLKPSEDSDSFDPQAPDRAASGGELPSSKSATAETLNDSTSSDDVQATERLPQPQTVPALTAPALPVPDEADSPSQPAPSRRAPESPPASPDVDDIFDSPAPDFGANLRRGLRRLSLEQAREAGAREANHTATHAATNAATHEDDFVKQARAAFSSAIQDRIREKPQAAPPTDHTSSFVR